MPKELMKSKWAGQKIVEMEIERLSTFKNHPFHVVDDEDMKSLKCIISKYGILTPILVRPIMDETYEIISGHRRKYARNNSVIKRFL